MMPFSAGTAVGDCGEKTAPPTSSCQPLHFQEGPNRLLSPHGPRNPFSIRCPFCGTQHRSLPLANSRLFSRSTPVSTSSILSACIPFPILTCSATTCANITRYPISSCTPAICQYPSNFARERFTHKQRFCWDQGEPPYFAAQSRIGCGVRRSGGSSGSNHWQSCSRCAQSTTKTTHLFWTCC